MLFVLFVKPLLLQILMHKLSFKHASWIICSLGGALFCFPHTVTTLRTNSDLFHLFCICFPTEVAPDTAQTMLLAETIAQPPVPRHSTGACASLRDPTQTRANTACFCSYPISDDSRTSISMERSARPCSGCRGWTREPRPQDTHLKDPWGSCLGSSSYLGDPQWRFVTHFKPVALFTQQLANIWGIVGCSHQEEKVMDFPGDPLCLCTTLGALAWSRQGSIVLLQPHLLSSHYPPQELSTSFSLGSYY